MGKCKVKGLGFPNIRRIILGGVSILRIIAFLRLYWCPLILGNYHFTKHQEAKYAV